MKEKITLSLESSQHTTRAIQSLKNLFFVVSRQKINARLTSNKAYTILSILLLALVLPSAANAHRGAKGDVDTCRISVGKEVIHFSAYTPSLSGGRSFCHVIPELGLTDLVIDYEGKKLRHTTVEFEVTKEPEGSRVYYHSPEKIKKGSIDAKVDFRKHGEGNYLLHVTVMNEGETIDSHLPFSVGLEPAESMIPMKILVPFLIIVVIFAVMFGMSRSKKNKSPDAPE